MKQQEKSLWEILKEKYGFKEHIFEVSTSSYQKFRGDLFPNFWLKLFPVKTIRKSSNDWLSATINGNFYEVEAMDIWYVSLCKNGVEIFNGRRFDNEDFLKLLV